MQKNVQNNAFADVADDLLLFVTEFKCIKRICSFRKTLFQYMNKRFNNIFVKYLADRYIRDKYMMCSLHTTFHNIKDIPFDAIFDKDNLKSDFSVSLSWRCSMPGQDAVYQDYYSLHDQVN